MTILIAEVNILVNPYYSLIWFMLLVPKIINLR